MSRSPLAYPLTRGVDGDAGGAADLQTDIMRFMAILSLCLVAIFALVQSLPLAPDRPAERVAEPPPLATVATPALAVAEEPPRVAEDASNPEPAATAAPGDSATKPDLPTRPPSTFQPAPPERISAASPAADATQGFTLRFASDIALTRLVARGDIGFYAIRPGGAARLAVRDSRLTFWAAPLPAAFHEMERSTVPQHVVEALQQSDDGEAGAVRWGVTLPRTLKQDLNRLMREHSGGALVIDDDGMLRREAT